MGWLFISFLTSKTEGIPPGIFVVLGLVAMAIIFTIISYKIELRKIRCLHIVEEHSESIKKLKELNARTDFEFPDLPDSLYEECTSKQRFNNISTDDFLIYSIRDRLTYYEKAIKIIESNRKKLEEYQQEVNRIIKTVAPLSQEQCRELKVRRLTARKFEDELFSQLLLYPTTDINLEVRIEYTTPAGKQSYHKEQVYSFQELQSVFYQAKNIMETEETKRAWIRTERAKMSDSLRYDVLKRDNFCCQICGATAEDGVKLHVDHIIPVSKGGKTEMSNLRTLCERCNLGKSDKM